jgi:FAD:protein FMN transferase
MKAGIMIRWIVPCLLFLVVACNSDHYVSLSGKTMGTYYSIVYRSRSNYQQEIDSILREFISAASTYDSTSEISHFNRHGEIVFRTPHLFAMMKIAKTIHRDTRGAFEPTLMPLITAHGFGGKKARFPSPQTIDSLLSLVSFEYIEFDSLKMKSRKRGVQLDLSAMGEGYVIDLISDFLESRGVHDYKVEIGGEMKSKGLSPKQMPWLIGIENPEANGEIMRNVMLDNEAISTSGNYRKFYTDSTGKHLSHIIDPKSGTPIQNTLLSVTIKNEKAVLADAFATASMAMGLDSAKAFVSRMRLDALITYTKNKEVLLWHSAGFFGSNEDQNPSQ